MIHQELLLAVINEASPRWIKLLLRAQAAIVILVTAACATVAFVLVPQMNRSHRTTKTYPVATSDSRDMASFIVSPDEPTKHDDGAATAQVAKDVSGVYMVMMAEDFCNKGKISEAKDVLDYANSRLSIALNKKLAQSVVPAKCLPQSLIEGDPSSSPQDQTPHKEK